MKNLTKLLVTSMYFFVINACTGTPQLNQQPIEIPLHELGQYWIPEISSFAYGSAPKKPGYVVVSYLVDSEGDIYDVKVINSKPEGLWVGVVKKSLRNTAFTPAPTNSTRIPVKVIAQYDFGR